MFILLLLYHESGRNINGVIIFLETGEFLKSY